LDPSESASIRRKAMEILGKLGDPRAAAPIAQRLKDPSDRSTASRALKALGSAAEDATIALLADPDAGVFDEACQVLGQIGGPKGIAALKLRVAPDHKGPQSARAALRELTRKH
jgi:HEAT repeat protein